MPTLAPGASAAVSTSITPPVTLPQGTYWISAVADLNRVIGEPNEVNNGLTSFAASKIVRPLNKLTRAAMSLTPNGCGDVAGPADQPRRRLRLHDDPERRPRTAPWI